MIDDLPLRWATDFVPLATSNSRLLHASVLQYALWNGDDPKSRQKRKLLAVATKDSIFLYETPFGERAFRFVKEFYTPLPAKSITFFQQSVPEPARRSSDAEPRPSSRFHGHSRTDSTGGLRSSEPPMIANYGTQLSLFVIFEKKAGWIRLADSAVGEMEFYDDGSSAPAGPSYREPSVVVGPNSNGGGSGFRKKHASSMEVPTSLGKWTPPAECELPAPVRSHTGPTKTVYVLTRGKQSQILPCPLPTPSIPRIPIHILNWRNPPSTILVRMLSPTSPDDGTESFIQLINLGEHGVEVQEVMASSLGSNGSGKGKGKASVEDTIWADADAGGETGFLMHGGHWDHPFFSPLHNPSGVSRTPTMSSTFSGMSGYTTSTAMTEGRMRKKDQGVYAWCRKGLEDWRIFWLGGTLRDDAWDEGEDEDGESLYDTNRVWQ
jgi:hypothetical protein